MNLPDPAETLEVEPSEIKQLLDSGGEEPGFRLVDCREEDEFALCRIEGGELIPLSVFAEQAPMWRMARIRSPKWPRVSWSINTPLSR